MRLPEDGDVVSGWQERPVDPNEPILADRDAQLVRETWPTKLVGVPLGSRILLALPSVAVVDAVHRQKEKYLLVVKVIYGNPLTNKVSNSIRAFFT